MGDVDISRALALTDFVDSRSGGYNYNVSSDNLQSNGQKRRACACNGRKKKKGAGSMLLMTGAAALAGYGLALLAAK